MADSARLTTFEAKLVTAVYELPDGATITRVISPGVFVVRLELPRGAHLIGFMALSEKPDDG